MQHRGNNLWRPVIAYGPPAAAGLALACLFALHGRSLEAPPAWPLVLFALLAIAAEWARIPLTEGGFQQFGPLVTIPAIAVLGPVPAALVAAFGTAMANFVLRRRPRETAVFNVGQRTVSMLLAGYVWTMLLSGHASYWRPSMDLQHALLVPALLGCLLTYALATVLQVSLRVASRRQQPFWTVLRANAPWQGLASMVLGASGMAVAVSIAGAVPRPGLPLLIIVYVAILYVARRQAARDFTDLHNAVSDLLMTLDRQELLARLADKIQRLADPDISYILLEGSDGAVEIAVASGIDPAALAPILPGRREGAAGWVAEHRRPLRISDYTTDPRRQAAAQAALGRQRIRSVMIVPLLAGSEYLGEVVLTKPAPDYFTAYQERIIATLAAQAGLTLKNARLYEESRRSLARVEALQRVARASAGGADLAGVQQTVLDVAVEALGADRGVLTRYDERDRTLSCVAARGLTREEAGLRAQVPGSDWRAAAAVQAVRTMRPAAIADRTLLPGVPSPLPAGRSRAVLAVPMLAGEGPAGALAVGRPDVHRWTADEIDLLQALANEAGVVLENARLSAATARQLQQMRALERISERINSQRDLNVIFDLIADSVRNVLGAQHLAIYLVGEPGGAVQPYGRGVPAEYLAAAQARLTEGTGFGNLAINLRKPLIAVDARNDPRTLEALMRRLGYASIAAFPLIFRDAVIGLLTLYHDDPRPYDEHDVALGEAFANQAAIAVQNTRLLQDAERRAHQFELLHNASTRIASSLQPRELCEILVEELHTKLGYPFVSIFTVRGDRLEAMAHRGYERPHLSIDIGRGVLGRTVRARQAVLVADVSADPDYVASDPSVTQEMCVPILEDERVVGVMNIEVIEPTLTRADLDLLRTLAGGVAVAMRNAALFTEVQRRRDELAALYESAQALSASLELATVVETLASATCRRFGYDFGTILLMAPHGDLVVRASYGTSARIGDRVQADHCAAGRAAREGRPVLVPDVTAAPGATSWQASGALIAVPIVHQGRVTGVFSVGTARPGALGERDEQLLTTLAAYGAVAIENAGLYESTQHLAATDGLTGLLNHRTFREALEQELERSKRYALPVSLLVIEIDKFKRYNDAYGHLRGDDVLRAVAGVLEREHRKRVDIVARYGGDEFVMLLPHTPRAAAAEVAERIRHAVETTPFIVGPDVTSVTLSLGVASCPEDGVTSDALVDIADSRMYAAKEAGGNKVTSGLP